jgi:hypothetical protein
MRKALTIDKFLEKVMKRFLLGLSLIAVMVCSLCACLNDGAFFSKKILQENFVPDLPKINCMRAEKQESKIYYVQTTEQAFHAYAKQVYEYLHSLDFEYLGTRGEKVSDFFGGMPTYAFLAGNEISDFLCSENCYVFVWANEWNRDTQNLRSRHFVLTYFADGIPVDENYNVSMQLNYTIESYRFLGDQ